jgi:hypothetical protein
MQSSALGCIHLIGCYGSYGVTKRCCLSWLTNSSLVYEPKCGKRGGVAGSQQMSSDVQCMFLLSRQVIRKTRRPRFLEVDAGMPEKRLIWHHFCDQSTVSVRHHGQSGTADHRLVRHCPAITSVIAAGLP